MKTCKDCTYYIAFECYASPPVLIARDCDSLHSYRPDVYTEDGACRFYQERKEDEQAD